MKRLLLFLSTLVMGAMLWAQSPQSFTYQAVVRNAAGQALAEQNVGVRLSLRQGSANGAEQYVKLHTVTTNVAGLITLAVGEGAVQTQTTLADIDWANGPWFLCTEVDPTGGSNYVLSSTQQLHSVPYALHATDVEARAQVAALEGKADSLQVANEAAMAALDAKTDSLHAVNATGIAANAAAIDSLSAMNDSLHALNAESIAALDAKADSLHVVNAAGIAANVAAIDSLNAKSDSLHAEGIAAIESLDAKTDSLHTVNAAGILANTAGVEANAEAIAALIDVIDSLNEANADALASLNAANDSLKATNDSLKAANAALQAEVSAFGTRMQQYVDSAIAAALQSIGVSDTNNGGETPAPTTVPEGYVDLGLPSGLLWATCNLGATSPEEYGVHYAWGETTTKSMYDWSTYQYANGDYDKLTKYCNDSDYGYNGFTDNLTTLLPEDDAATQVQGSGARIPTKEEWQELMDNTTAEWTTMNGVNGRLFTAANGNTLFLPAAGYRSGVSLYGAGGYGYYWSASLYEAGPSGAWGFYFGSGGQDMGYYSGRNYGQSVRAVRASEN